MSIIFFMFISVVLFFLGTAIGSFVNVMIYRSMQGESWVTGRSHCESCKYVLQWYDMFPLVSFLVLGGACRKCRTPIGIAHPVIEFLTGTLFVWWWWGGSLFFRLTHEPLRYVQPAFWLAVGVILLIIFLVDLRYYIIPDEAVVGLTVLTLLYRVALVASGVMRQQDFLLTLVGLALCVGLFFSLWFFTKGRGFGFGDVKFAIPFSLLLGWPNVIVGVFLAFVMGAGIGLLLIVTKQRTLKQAVPFGPFLVVSTFITLLFGSSMLQWYLGLLR